MEENIFFDIFEDDNINDIDNDTKIDVSNILGLDDYNNNNENLYLYPEIVNYKINYTVKQLLLICDYYGILKNIKLAKANKDDIINNLVLFENNMENFEIVFKRKQMWHYMEEIKSDKFMKKFILLWI
jgi:hypothetical protein